jgi:hypothetical protein
MAYEKSQATSIDDLFRTKLRTFATANGWTDSEGTSVAGRQYFEKTDTGLNCKVAFRWDTTTPGNVGVYNHLTYSGSGTVPGSHGDDSGNGTVTSFSNTTANNSRRISLDNDTNNYWFFESDDYIHCVVETTAGNFRHFGFGQIAKVGTWTGGEYAYAQQGSTNSIGTSDGWLLDGLARGASVSTFQATMHIEGTPGIGSSKWAVVWGGGATSIGNDRAGNVREFVQGGFRSGPMSFPFAKWSATPLQGLIPLTPIWCFLRRTNSAPTTSVYPLGYMKDVRAINMRHHNGGDELLIGSDTWVVFPTATKNVSGDAGHQGIAYRKVTT